MKALAFGSFALAFLLSGCGGGQTHGAAFDAEWVSDDGVAIAELQHELAKVPIPLGADVAIGVDPHTIYGLDLTSGARWTFAHALESRPTIAGSVVVGVGGGELFALDARSGKQLWKRSGAGLLRGAGDDGKITVISLASTIDKGTTVLVVTHDGGVLRQIEDSAAIGVPSVVDGYVFLPWQGQYVTAYDVSAGTEKARVLLRSQTSRVFASGGSLFFGELAATRFDEKIRLGASSRASTAMLPTRDLPAAASWMRTGLEPEPVRAGAADKVRLYARPAASGAAAIEGDRFAATYYRIALGFGAHRGELAWAHLHEADILGGSAFSGGFALCDAKGKVSFIDATSGEVTGQAAFGKPIDACVVQTDGLKKPPKAAKKPLPRQIASCMSSSEQELATVQKFLLHALVSSADDEVTGALVELAESDQTSPFVISDVRAALAARRTGASFMLASLERHVDWLAGVKHPPPVAPLADALLGMKERRGAPLLVAHLLDPADTPEDLEHAAAALAVLADKSEAPGLKTFFAMYRGATGLEGQEQIEHATTSVAEALIRLGEGQIVAEATADSFTSGGVKTRIASLKR